MAKGKLEILEGLRGFAALYVVVHHLKLYQYHPLGYLTSQGQGAVILFFVLSGFVMYYANYRYKESERFNFKTYFIKRFRRIYPVFLIALFIAYAAKSMEAGSLMPLDIKNLLGNLFNLQDHNRMPNNWFVGYYGNGPLWSLSYEWWFYILFFPIFKYISEDRQKFLVLAISIIGAISFYIFYNKISLTLSYFVIWWSGVELCRSWVKHNTIDKKTILNIFIGHLVIMSIMAVPIIMYYLDGATLTIGRHPVAQFRHYSYSFFIIATGIIWYRFKFKGLKMLLKPFLLFAPISYGIYVFHAPFIFRTNPFGLENEFLKVSIGMVCVFILAYLAEVRLQKVINKATNKWLK